MTEPKTKGTDGAGTGQDGGFVARRGVLGGLLAVCSSVIAGLVGLPGLRHILEPVLAKGPAPGGWREIGEASVLEGATEPVVLPIIGERVDAWTRAPKQVLGSVWLRKKGDGALHALTAECPHLGCKIGYDAEAKNFVCPCHTSAFDLDGKVLYGPAPRAMDELEARERDGKIDVRFVRYQMQIKEKVEAS